jgi:lipopolysaccharide export LptBFGC system permease protein LptF
MDRPSPLEDPATAAHAWRRYRRLMWWMAGAATIVTALALSFLYARHGWANIHLYIAAAAGVFLSVLLGAGLMGLVFLSAGTGHDEVITDRLEDERNRP